MTFLKCQEFARQTLNHMRKEWAEGKTIPPTYVAGIQTILIFEFKYINHNTTFVYGIHAFVLSNVLYLIKFV